MSDIARLQATIEAVMGGGDSPEPRAVGVCRACAQAVPVDGAAMTVMASDEQRQTLYATDAVADRVEQLQYTVGAGPSLDAFTSGRPVVVSDLADSLAPARWPVFAQELVGLPIGALWAIPMRFAVVPLGVAFMYRRAAGALTRDELALTLGAVDLATLALLELREAGLASDGAGPGTGVGTPDGSGRGGVWLDGAWLGAGLSRRRQVHQATGMVMAQLGVSSGTAFARMRGHAFAAGRDLDQVADDVVARRLRLDQDPG